MRTQVRYEGRVQGVGFRMTATAIARRYPVTGWVRNEIDGSVLLEVQGSANMIDAVLVELGAQMRGFISKESRLVIGDVSGESGFVIER